MSYFNHAFKKTFVGTEGFVQDGSTATSALQTGYFGFYDKSWNNQLTAPTNGTPLYLVAGSIHTNDQIGPFAGGYTESVKSKLINPRYVSGFWKVSPANPQQMIITVGHTSASGDISCNLNSGTVVDKEFLCNSTYNLRVDIKGSPALRFLTRNSYYTAAAYTGCCAEGVDGIGQPVNPLIVYTQWAYQLLNSPLIAPFINVQVTYSINGGTSWEQLAPSLQYTDNGVLVPAGASSNMDQTNGSVTLLDYITGAEVYPEAAVPSETLVGLIITGGYIDTQFGNCTFYPSDSLIAKLEPVKVYASEVDLNGDPCAFGGVCVANACLGMEGVGFGETVVRDLIMTEAYMQQPFYTGQDLRIREITNGDDVTDVIDRTQMYTRYYIQHSVPRFNNPSGTFDNDQYLLEIIAPENTTTPGTTTWEDFQTFMDTWLSSVGNEIPLIDYTNSNPNCTNVPAVIAGP